MKLNEQAARDQSADRRDYQRITTALTGNLFIPAEGVTLDCRIINLSGSGAGVQCAEPPPLDTFIVLHIDGFGRFEGVATRYVEGELGLRFVCKEAKRQRLLADLAVYLNSGVTPLTGHRLHPRMSSVSVGYFQRPNGNLEPCDVLDFSPQGISLRTNCRPPIGEIVSLGLTCGRVLRHHQDGIALQLIEGAPSAEACHGN